MRNDRGEIRRYAQAPPDPSGPGAPLPVEAPKAPESRVAVRTQAARPKAKGT
jgi:hypothetical protein